MKKPIRFAVWFSSVATTILALGGVPVRAQLTTTGTINGTVLDPAGAVIPGAKVLIRETQRKIVTQTVSNSSGDFVQVGLDSGHYEVTVSASGFATYRETNIYLDPARPITCMPCLSRAK